METGKKYIQVIINSPDDLPKEDGVYFVAKKNNLKTSGLKPMIYTIISKKEWLKDVEYYLIEQPEPEQRTADKETCPECGYFGGEHKHGCSEYYNGREQKEKQTDSSNTPDYDY